MNVWNEFWRIFPPSSAPSSSLSNYIIIFLSIKIRMNNLNVWQQPGSEREGFCSAAGRQGCFWWAMHAKLTLLWWKKRRSETIKEKKQSAKKFHPCEILTPRLQKCDTKTYWLIWNIKQGYKRGCSRWKHAVVLANTCQSALVSCSLIRVNDIIGATVVQKQFRQMQSVGYISTNRKTIHEFKPNIRARWCAHAECDSDSRWTSDETVLFCIKHEIESILNKEKKILKTENDRNVKRESNLHIETEWKLEERTLKKMSSHKGPVLRVFHSCCYTWCFFFQTDTPNGRQ